jgi:hypothetical protein
MLGVTKAPENVTSATLKRMLSGADSSPMMQTLSERVFLYDPLDSGGADFCSRVRLTEQLIGLQGIPQAQSRSMFQTVLTDNDERELIAIVTQQSKTLQEKLDSASYAETNSC